MALRDPSLDPENWASLRALGHRMLDDAFDALEGVREGPVWQEMPDAVRAAWKAELPQGDSAPEDVYARYRHLIAPYAVGNRHPRFLGWVHGAGTPIGGLAEMLAGFLNANCGGRDHAPIAVEAQVIRWAAAMLGFPEDASGVLLSGTSMANFCAILIARTGRLGTDVRRGGVGGAGLVGYAAQGAHLCVARGFDMAGLGADALRLIPVDAMGRMRPDVLRERLAEDRAHGRQPFLLVGTAGSVDIGAIDDLTGLADLAAQEGLWLHVDAAFGAIAMLSPTLRPRLAGIERADSVAFDFHKWTQVPYESGCLVVRDPAAHRASFARQADYLARAPLGLAGGTAWPVDFGPELSRGFRALKVWMTLSTYGADRLGAVTSHCVALAERFAALIDTAGDVERAAPVPLNIVCFRVAGLDDAGHVDLAARLQLAGQTVLSTTTIEGRTVLRAAFVNHRTTEADLPVVLSELRAAITLRDNPAKSNRSPQTAPATTSLPPG
ncbi:MAG: pyridoxal-dependent decarboxylase [Acetobacteraceae bacterium]|nr:pyridoxal-dependent decarboxylase [Acetobacteraceae bacterium]